MGEDAPKQRGAFAHQFSNTYQAHSEHEKPWLQPQCRTREGPVQLMCRVSEIEEAGTLPSLILLVFLNPPQGRYFQLYAPHLLHEGGLLSDKWE